MEYADFVKVFLSFKMSYGFAIHVYIKFAIVEPAQSIDHHDISNTIDSKSAITVAETAISDVSSCSVFPVFYVKRALRLLATKIFDLSVLIFGLFIYVYSSSQKVGHCPFYILGNSVFYTAYLLYRFSSVLVFIELQSLENRKWRSCYR
jgi:hypothetical protein